MLKVIQCQAFNAKFSCSLHFIAKDIDPISGQPEEVGYEDSYVLEDIDLQIYDFLSPFKSTAALEVFLYNTLRICSVTNGLQDWETLPSSTESCSSGGLGQCSSFDEAAQKFARLTKLSLCQVFDLTGKTSPKRSYIFGAAVNWHERLLAKIDLSVGDLHDYTVDVRTRADSIYISKAFHEALATSLD